MNIKRYFVRPTESGTFDVIEAGTDRVVVEQEGFNIAFGIAARLNNPDWWDDSELTEVVERVRERSRQ